MQTHQITCFLQVLYEVEIQVPFLLNVEILYESIYLSVIFNYHVILK